MNLKSILAGAVLAGTTMVAAPAWTAASDYAFEPVTAEVKRGFDVTVAVRLVHKPSGKAVSDAVIVRRRLDMAPDGMADMDAPLSPVASDEPGTYAFKTEMAMAGRWLLSIAAKVQGEPETVIGKITFVATR